MSCQEQTAIGQFEYLFQYIVIHTPEAFLPKGTPVRCELYQPIIHTTEILILFDDEVGTRQAASRRYKLGGCRTAGDKKAPVFGTDNLSDMFVCQAPQGFLPLYIAVHIQLDQPDVKLSDMSGGFGTALLGIADTGKQVTTIIGRNDLFEMVHTGATEKSCPLLLTVFVIFGEHIGVIAPACLLLLRQTGTG